MIDLAVAIIVLDNPGFEPIILIKEVEGRANYFMKTSLFVLIMHVFSFDFLIKKIFLKSM
jgi:hypothetical protein